MSEEKKKPKRKQSGGDPARKKSHTRVGEVGLMTKTFACEEFLMNFNFHVIGNCIMDPYISEYMTSTVNMTIYAFNINDEVETISQVRVFKGSGLSGNSPQRLFVQQAQVSVSAEHSQ